MPCHVTDNYDQLTVINVNVDASLQVSFSATSKNCLYKHINQVAATWQKPNRDLIVYTFRITLTNKIILIPNDLK